MATRKLSDPEPEITARPRTSTDGMVARIVEEDGLSVEPDDLGKQFLAEATEQGNFESSVGPDAAEIYVTGAPPTDEPVENAERGSVWTQTVDATLESGNLEALNLGPPRSMENAEQEPVDEERRLIEDFVDDVSLFDEESAELGDVKPPRMDTDDTGRRMKRAARRRGSHSA